MKGTIVLLWLLLIMGGTTAFSVKAANERGQSDACIDAVVREQAHPKGNYPKVFGRDWTDAVHFVGTHHEEWKQEFDLFGVDSRMAEAIVFPELIRYSMWQDEIEKVAVNGLYISKGQQGANFSIGRFQMKPSFAEEVEQAWNSSSLSKEYGFSFNLGHNAEARRSRIRRLSTMQGQCRYLAIFVRLLQLRLPQLQQVSKKEQVRLLATAYNRSFTASWRSLSRMQHERHFHTDVIPTHTTRFYCYSDIAVTFYQRGN